MPGQENMGQERKKRLELLAPAGDRAGLQAALRFGADAVYVGGPALQLRAASAGFTMEGLAEAAAAAHAAGKRLYVTVNAFAENDELAALAPYARALHALGADAAIVSDEYTWEEVHEKSQKEWRTFTLNYKTILKPHLINVLKDLKSQNLKLAIASSSPYDNIMQVVKECEIQDYFEYMTSGEDFKESKPNPEIYDHTIKKLGLKPDEVIAIEDSTYGIEAALQSGCTCIALEDTRFGFDQSKAHYLVKDLFQANKIINKVKSQ